MRTRQKDERIPRPEEPWNEIRTGLFMGGHFWTDRDGEYRPVIVGEQFDLVVSLVDYLGHGPAEGVEHLVVRLPDGPLVPAQIGAVRDLALRVRDAVEGGGSVLVRCHAGYNRSGLVVGQALIELGSAPGAAIDLIRRQRSPWALHNELFAQYLTAGLDVVT